MISKHLAAIGFLMALSARPAPALSDEIARHRPLGDAERRDLGFALKMAPIDAFEEYLKKESRLARLDSRQKQELLESLDQRLWPSRVGYFALNFVVFPGLGSLIQGDTTWGLAIGGSALAGLGVFLGGLFEHIASRSPSLGWLDLTPTMQVGVVIMALAAVASWVRPWVYEPPRHRMLRGHFINLMQLAPPSVWIEPLVVPPLSFATRPRQGSGFESTAYGLGLAGRF